jgi:hypothetical protein
MKIPGRFEVEINGLGFEKRVKSPTSVTGTTALISAIPRIASKPSTMGRKV